MLPSGLEIAISSCGDGQHDVAQAVSPLPPLYLGGKFQPRAQSTVGDENGKGFELKLLVLGISGERITEKIRRRSRVTVAPSGAPRQIAAQRRNRGRAVLGRDGFRYPAVAEPVCRCGRPIPYQSDDPADHEHRRPGSPIAASASGLVVSGHPLARTDLVWSPRSLSATHRPVTCSGSLDRRRPRAPPN